MRSLGTAGFISLAMIMASCTFGCSDEVGIGGKAAAGSGAEGAEMGGEAAADASAGESSGGSGAVEATGGVGAVAGAGATSTGGVGAAAGMGATSSGGIGAASGAGAMPSAGAGATAPVSDMLCEPGLYFHCHGDDGCRGQQLCLESGEQLGACVCFPSGQPVVGAWDDEAGRYTAGPEVPLVVPISDDRPHDQCPTRIDLADGTVCEEQPYCSWGACSAFCECVAGEWHCGVLLC